MIKFFRNIRKSLVNEGKTSKYLKYAIGEIVLVVIGILIALQINNWNQERLNKNFEITMLKQLKTALKSDLRMHDMLKERAESKDNSIQELLEMMASNKTYADSTLLNTYNQMIMGFKFNYNEGAYQSIKSAGLDKISNDSLRKILVATYEVDLPRLEEFINSSKWFTQGNEYKLQLHNALWKREQKQFPDKRWKIISSPINNEFFLKQYELIDRIKIEQDLLQSINGLLNVVDIVLKDCLNAVNQALEKYD